MSTPSSSLRRCRPLLGTFVSVTIAEPRAGAHEAIERAFATVAQVQRAMSFHDAGSDVGRLNAAAGRPVRLSAATWRVLQRAQAWAARSGGAFDAVVGGELAGRGFLARSRARARASSWHDLVLLPRGRARLRRGARVDLGGIAKGYAVDRAVAALRRAGIGAGCVNAGGDLRVFGPQPWRIAVRLPGAPGRVSPVIELQDGAIATSGGYLRRRRIGRRLWTPLADPKARGPLAPFASASVVAPTCLAADALTKVVLADPAGAAALLARHRARALTLDRRGRLRAIPCPGES
jgi:thiamine biosynthesis lipoprotein